MFKGKGGYIMITYAFLFALNISQEQKVKKLYDHGKPVLLTELGDGKNDVFVMPKETEDGIVLENVYGYDIIIGEEETTSVKHVVPTKLYRHHFDVVLSHADLPAIPEGSPISINVNAMSTSGDAWETLGELDGGGFIVSAFGMLSTNVVELKLFYKASETLLIQINNLSDGSVTAVALTSVNGGTPSEFELQDSVTPL